MITIKEAELPGDQRQPDELMAQGWVYRDIPWMTDQTWSTIMDAIGVENMKMLAMSRRPTRKPGEGDYDRRGQLLIGPAGIENLTRWLAARR